MLKSLHDCRPELVLGSHLKDLRAIIQDLHFDNAAGVCGVDAECRLRRLALDSQEKLNLITAQLDAEYDGADGCHD